MAGTWRKVLVGNTKGTASSDLVQLDHILPDDLAMNAESTGGVGNISGVDGQALHINNSNKLEWKDVVTTFAALTDTDTTTTNLADNDIMVYDSADSKYKMMPTAGDVLLSITGSVGSEVATMTIQPDSVALGTDTTGNYVEKGATSGVGISGSVDSEGGAFTVTSNATSANNANTIVSRDASGGFTAGTITANLTGTASLATEFTVTANNSADETVYPLFAEGASGDQGAETDSAFTYNPSSGLLTSTGFAGNLNGTVGATAPAAGAFTTLSSTGTTNLGSTTVDGDFSHMRGIASFGGGSMRISGLNPQDLQSYVIDTAQTGTWPLADDGSSTVTFGIINLHAAAVSIASGDMLWFKAQDHDANDALIPDSYSYVKLESTAAYSLTATVGETATTTWNVIDWPTGTRIAKGTSASKVYSADPAANDTNITIDDTVMFSGGGTFTSATNFVTTDALVQLNTNSDATAYAVDSTSGIVFGTLGADTGTSPEAYKTGGKLLNTDNAFVFGTFADVASSTPASQDNVTHAALKDIRVKAIQFSTDRIDEDAIASYSGDNPYLGVGTDDALYFYMAD